MPASLLGTPTFRTLRMSADDREFEDLLQRAADILKSRRPPADDEEATETRESLETEERDSDG